MLEDDTPNLGCISDKIFSVQGRLREHAQFWEEQLEASRFVLDIVKAGYCLPFITYPPPLVARNHKSALEHAKFVKDSIDELVLSHCVQRVVSCPTVCSPLQVVANAKGKLRLVIDLRYLNQFLVKAKFKYEGLNLIPVLFRKGDLVFTFDLKSGYHHVDINEDFQQYLGFSWGEGSCREFYYFRVLPFGLSTACYVFTKLLRPLVKRWRSMGLRAIVYIDDGICASSSMQEAIVNRDAVVSDIESAGIVLNITKSRLHPVHG